MMLEIKLLADSLAPGTNLRTQCPVCKGGTSSEKSLSITLGEDGVLRWQCFRTKCSLSPGNTETGSRLKSEPLERNKPKAKFEDKTCELSPQYRAWIRENWGLDDPPYWYFTRSYGGRVAMSIRSPKFTHRGWVLRDVSGRARTKALTFIDEGETSLSWYRPHRQAPLIIVEDIPSALRASKYVNAVALLGTAIGPDKAAEIGQYSSGDVMLALDQDATELSFRYRKQWGLAWGKVDVVPLKRDIKNMTEDECINVITALLGKKEQL